MRSVGSGNRPRLTVSNLFGLVTGLSARYGQLAGAEVVRRLTYARFLDAVNFTNGNPSADSTQEAVERYTVEQLASLTAETAVLELAAPSESDGAAVPSRVMLAESRRRLWLHGARGCRPFRYADGGRDQGYVQWDVDRLSGAVWHDGGVTFRRFPGRG